MTDNSFESKKMAPIKHRILYATDLSSTSVYAYHYAIKYAIKHEAKLIVFHVISKRSITFSKIFATFFNEAHEHTIIKEKVNSAMKRMQNQLEILGKNNLINPPEFANNVEHLVVHYGKIAEEIVKKADMWGCKLIVIGPHKNGLLKQLSPVSASRKAASEWR